MRKETEEKRPTIGASTAARARTGSTRLTAAAVEGLPPRASKYEVTDPGSAGLKLRVSPTGTKSWFYRFYWEGARQRLALGLWPDVSLADAREMAVAARRMIKRGIDPRTAGLVSSRPAPRPANVDLELGSTNPHSVASLAAEFMRLHVSPNRKRPDYVHAILHRDVLPRWAKRDARTITPREVIELLDRIVARGSKVMANRTAGILGQMFRFGIHRSLVETSPVQLLYRPGGKEKSRRRVLSEEELRAFTQNLREACRYSKMTHVLRFLLLTLQRREELALASWDEFDFKKKAWSIPDEHSKNGRGHVLPLSGRAVEELLELKKLSGESRYVLPRPDGRGPIDPKYITRSVAKLQSRFRKIGIAHFTAHDLRRTGRTNLGRLGVSRHVAERVLNHTPERIEGTYDVYEYFDEKREALERWSGYLDGLSVA
jgi:integrase